MTSRHHTISELQLLASKLKTKDGLLWVDGEMLPVSRADWIAQDFDFLYAERLVRALEENPDVLKELFK